MIKGLNRDSQIKLMVNEKELQQIKNNALACGKSTSAYIREIALNMCILNIDDSCVTNHTNEISANRNAINQLVFTIKSTGNYTPVDLEYILEKINEMLKSEKIFLNNYDKAIESNKKLISRTVRNIVKKHLKK